MIVKHYTICFICVLEMPPWWIFCHHMHKKLLRKVTTWWPAKLLTWKALEILHDCRDNWITLFFWVDHSTICHFRHEMRTRAEMRPAVVSGTVTGDAPISQWSFFPVPSNSPRIHCESHLDPVSLSFLKWQMLLSPDDVFISMFKIPICITLSIS